MFCTNCGCNVDEGSGFCNQCGAPLEAEPAMSSYGAVAAPSRGAISDRAIALVRSPLFLAATLCVVAGLIFQLIASADTANGVIYGIITSIPLILEVIGLCVLIGCAHKRTGAGIGVIKAGIIVQIVCASILACLLAFVLVMGIVGMSRVSDQLMVVMIVAFVVSAIGITLLIMYLASLLSCLNVARDAIAYDTYTQRPSLYPAAMNFISGVLGIIIAASTIFFLSYMADAVDALLESVGSLPVSMEDFVDGMFSDSIMNIIASMLSPIGIFLFGIVIVKGRSLNAAPHLAEDPVRITGGTCMYCGRELSYGEECNCRTAVVDPITPTRFCIHCGKTLHGDEVCSCVAPVVTPEEKRFCNQCGRELHGDEVCSCMAPVAPPVKKRFCGNCGRELHGDEVCECMKPAAPPEKTPPTEPTSRLYSTMRTRKSADAGSPEDNAQGASFFNSAGDL